MSEPVSRLPREGGINCVQLIRRSSRSRKKWRIVNGTRKTILAMTRKMLNARMRRGVEGIEVCTRDINRRNSRLGSTSKTMVNREEPRSRPGSLEAACKEGAEIMPEDREKLLITRKTPKRTSKMPAKDNKTLLA